MRTDQPDPHHRKVLSLATARADHLAQTLGPKLREYLQAEQVAEDVAWDLTRCFPIELFDELEPEIQELAADWLAFEFVTHVGDTLAQRLALHGPSLSPDERDTLIDWNDGAIPGFFRVDAVSGREVRLTRLPDDAPFVARTLGAAVRPGNLVVTWLLPTPPVYHFGTHAAVLDGGLAGGLRHLLRVEMELLRRQRPNVTWNDFYRTSWPRIIWYLLFLVDGDEVGRIQAPPGPPVLWDGRWIEGAPDWWEQVAYWVRASAQQCGRIPEEPADGAERLWWDAALALRPKQDRPESWAAGVICVFRRYILGDGTVTQADVASQCGVSLSAVGNCSRQVVKALGVQPFDPRYVDLLAPDVRVLWEMHCLAALGATAPFGGADVSKMTPDSLLALHRMLREMARYLRD